jgi:hypothetical protein
VFAVTFCQVLFLEEVVVEVREVEEALHQGVAALYKQYI